MVRVANTESSRLRFFSRFIYITGAQALLVSLLLGGAGMRTAEAAIYIGGSPPTTLVAPGAYWFRPWLAAPQGTHVKFSISYKPYWASFDASTGALSAVARADNVGTYRDIKISTTDTTSTVSTTSFAISLVAAGTTR